MDNSDILQRELTTHSDRLDEGGRKFSRNPESSDGSEVDGVGKKEFLYKTLLCFLHEA